jgi:hypothetical protein
MFANRGTRTDFSIFLIPQDNSSDFFGDLEVSRPVAVADGDMDVRVPLQQVQAHGAPEGIIPHVGHLLDRIQALPGLPENGFRGQGHVVRHGRGFNDGYLQKQILCPRRFFSRLLSSPS